MGIEVISTSNEDCIVETIYQYLHPSYTQETHVPCISLTFSFSFSFSISDSIGGKMADTNTVPRARANVNCIIPFPVSRLMISIRSKVIVIAASRLVSLR